MPRGTNYLGKRQGYFAPFFIPSSYSTDLLDPSAEARALNKLVMVFEILRGSPIKMDYMQDTLANLRLSLLRKTH